MSQVEGPLLEKFDVDLEKAGTVVTQSWTSSAGGASTETVILRGWLIGIRYIPAGGGSAPSANYDHSLIDSDGVDVLLTPSGTKASLGRDLSATDIATYPECGDGKPILCYVNGAYTSTIANAGDTKGGTIVYKVKNR